MRRRHLIQTLTIAGVATGTMGATVAVLSPEVFGAKVNTTVQFTSTSHWGSEATPYKSGLISVLKPRVPAAFEQSAIPKGAVATIESSTGTGYVSSKQNVATPAWLRQIDFHSGTFRINGQVYTLPPRYRGGTLLLLPIDKGIVWAPVTPVPDLRHVKQALAGNTPIYFRPYSSSGGSLAAGAKEIASLPHRWMGLDGPTFTTAWTGWLPRNTVKDATVEANTVYHVTYTKNQTVKQALPTDGSEPAWKDIYAPTERQKSYTNTPHYSAYADSLTRTYGGFVLDIGFMDATMSGRNAGLSDAAYYWSEKTGKWTPLTENYGVQTLVGRVQTGSDGVYWLQPVPLGNGNGSQLDVGEFYFNPQTVTTESLWLGDWFFGPSFVDGSSWVTVQPKDMPVGQNGTVKSWTVYTPTPTKPVFNTTVTLPDGRIATPERAVDWKDIRILMQVQSLPASTTGTPSGYYEVVGNHSTVLSHKVVTTPAGKVTLVLNERTGPAANPSIKPVYEYWAIHYGKEYTYAMVATVIGDRHKAEKEVLQLLNHWKVPN